jgi:membrane fusion protein, multidrug efflux system
MDALTRGPVEAPPRGPIEVAPRSRSRAWPMAALCVLVLAAIAGAIWFWPAGSTKPADARHKAAEAIPVLVAPVVRRDVPIWLDGLGTVQAFYTVTIHTMIDGPLVSVGFKEGQDVRKGEVLAQVDPRTYQASLDQTTAKKAQDDALLANARVDLTRYQKLVATNYTTAQQADTQKSLVAQLEAQVRQDQAQIDNARTLLGYCTIVSPIDGRTGIRQIDPGNIVHAVDTTGLVMVTQLEPISVLFTLPQQTLPGVANAMRQGTAPKGGDGAPGGATVLAYAQGAAGNRGEMLDTGVLSVLDNQVDPTTGTIKLKATFPNKIGRLWPGGFVGVRLQVDTAHDAIVVPPAAIQRGPSGTYVFVATGATVKRQPVTVGHEDEQESIVTEGLSVGDRVVIDGASRLSDGTKITVVQPTAAELRNEADRPSTPGTRPQRSGGSSE